MSLDTLTINWFAVFCIASLYLFLYLLGSRASRRAAILDFTAMTLAGRRLPLGIGILTVTATWVGGGYLTGTAELRGTAEDLIIKGIIDISKPGFDKIDG